MYAIRSYYGVSDNAWEQRTSGISNQTEHEAGDKEMQQQRRSPGLIQMKQDEQIVDAQRLFDDVRREKVQRRVETTSGVDPRVEGQCESDPHRTRNNFV